MMNLFDLTLVKDCVISKATATEMDSRLQFVHIRPQEIVLMGADFFNSPRLLTQRYPEASLLEIEPDLAFLQASQRIGKKSKNLWEKFRNKHPKQIQQSLYEPINLAGAEMLWSNLSLQIDNDISGALSNWSHILKAEGMLFMATFGPDTLQEVFTLLQTHHIEVKREKLWDMHDIGDILLANGFMQPITDMSRLSIQYKAADNFWEDMALLRLFDAFQIQAPKEVYQKLITDAIEQKQLETITLEIVYAHALKKPEHNENEHIIHFHPKTS